MGLGGILGLLATMFSLIYSAPRQFYALARDAHLPSFVAHTNRRGVPDFAMLLVAVIGPMVVERACHLARVYLDERQ